MKHLSLLVLALHLAAIVRGAEWREASHEGRASWVYRCGGVEGWFDVAGGGFSRLIDSEGRDWVAFSREPLGEFPASAAAGFRGLGNLLFKIDEGGGGHPGFDQCVSERTGDVIRVRTKSGRWEWTWTVEPGGVLFEMVRAPEGVAWWFLYEGTVAGGFEPPEEWARASDGFEVRGPAKPGIGSQHNAAWRWVEVGQEGRSGVLRLEVLGGTPVPSNLWWMGAQAKGRWEDSTDGMLVLGLGRSSGKGAVLFGSGLQIRVTLQKGEG